MTRISTFCVVTSALAALALSVSSAGAFKMESPKVIVPTPKVTVKPPLILPKRQNTEQFKPKNPIVRY
jgi:hypothetical protein